MIHDLFTDSSVLDMARNTMYPALPGTSPNTLRVVPGKAGYIVFLAISRTEELMERS